MQRSEANKKGKFRNANSVTNIEKNEVDPPKPMPVIGMPKILWD